MPYLITHFWPGATEEQYRVTVARVRELAGGELPESFHAAGPTEGGFLIVAVHDSRESFQRFLDEVLIPAMPIEGGFSGRPEERTAEMVSA